MAPGSTSICGITTDAPASTKCHFFRISPGELLTLLTNHPNSVTDRGLQRSGCLFESRCFLESKSSYDNSEKDAGERGADGIELKRIAQGHDEGEEKEGTHPPILGTNRAEHGTIQGRLKIWRHHPQ